MNNSMVIMAQIFSKASTSLNSSQKQKRPRASINRIIIGCFDFVHDPLLPNVVRKQWTSVNQPVGK
jgi:hypothetical protein